MRTRTKICGITRVEDGAASATAGADAIGLMFYSGSKRNVALPLARAIVESLPPFVGRVGVFVNPSVEQVRAAVAQCGLTAVQLHGEETPEFCESLRGLTVIKAFRVQDRAILQELPRFSVSAWLLDSHVAGSRGGTGQPFDWGIAKEATRLGTPVILAGGLNPDNVADAIRAVGPYAVDVSSGVEISAGVKDIEKVKRFVNAATTT